MYVCDTGQSSPSVLACSFVSSLCNCYIRFIRSIKSAGSTRSIRSTRSMMSIMSTRSVSSAERCFTAQALTPVRPSTLHPRAL